MTYETLTVERLENVARITLNRPQALNALNETLINELNTELAALNCNPQIGCIILTGSDKAFAAGADIKEMKDKSLVDVYLENFLSNWDKVTETRKPIIAAVAGFCLGGGCELAMMCDFIIAATTAKFGQPEITLGIIPGAGGTQRLTRAVGKAKAMDLVLTGRMMDATEAERCGLVSRVVEPDKLGDEALSAARKIAGFSQPVTLIAKEAVNSAFETNLQAGLAFERRLIYMCFGLEDQKEGMTAFLEKRKPQFKNR